MKLCLWRIVYEKKPFDLTKEAWGARYVEHKNPLKRHFLKHPTTISRWDENYQRAFPPKAKPEEIVSMIRVITEMTKATETEHELAIIHRVARFYLAEILTPHFCARNDADLDELAWSVIAAADKCHSTNYRYRYMYENGASFNIAWALFESNQQPLQYEYFKTHLERVS